MRDASASMIYLPAPAGKTNYSLFILSINFYFACQSFTFITQSIQVTVILIVAYYYTHTAIQLRIRFPKIRRYVLGCEQTSSSPR